MQATKDKENAPTVVVGKVKETVPFGTHGFVKMRKRNTAEEE